MTECSKVVQEIEYKFYSSYDSAQLGVDFALAIVEVSGTVPPSSVVKTVLKNKYEILPVGHAMALTGVENLASARFQLVKVKYNIPVKPYEHTEEVYIFESLI